MSSYTRTTALTLGSSSNLIATRHELISRGLPRQMKAADRSHQGLWAGFLRSAEKVPGHPAVVVEGKAITYDQLREVACRIAATIQSRADDSTTPLTAVFAYRSPAAFAGVLGALLAGNGYVPLNRTFPVDRTQVMLDRSGCQSIIVDAASLPQLDALLSSARRSLVIVLPDLEDAGQLRRQWPEHVFIGSKKLAPVTL